MLKVFLIVLIIAQVVCLFTLINYEHNRRKERHVDFVKK